MSIAATETGARQVRLMGSGDDLLQLSFSGNSWVEIDDGARVRLYHDMLRAGDALTLQGTGPFHVLLGAAANVEVILNAETVDIAADTRPDNTARLVLGREAEAASGETY